jgi:hypothetical protein
MIALFFVVLAVAIAVAISRASAKGNEMADEIERQEYQRRNDLKGGKNEKL